MRVVRNGILLVALGFWPPLMMYAQDVKLASAVLVEKENVVEAHLGRAGWKAAGIGLSLALRDRLRTGEFSRAAMRFTDLSMLRVDELTTIEISPPVGTGGQHTLDVNRGGTYFFSRDRAQEIQIRTPAANGALRGTEFELRVASDGRTRLTMFDGEVDLGNAHGRILLRSGEQADVEIGRAPRKTPMIEAVNIIQWCLYYPGVLDPAELPGAATSPAYAAYRAGDLLGAIECHPLNKPEGSIDERLFRASLILSVGQVQKARAALAGVPAGDSRRQALEQVIAAVKFQPWSRAAEPRTSSEWMAESYYQQSRSNLEAALQAARKATELSPEFGFAWARVAELEFSFGRTPRAFKVLERGLELAPHNAQAHALQGFLLAAENRMGAARRSFDKAIDLDGALGNAWLGRGLSAIRQGRETEGRYDLQTAAVLEPNRSIMRSYLGKAFSQVGINQKANLEFERAKVIDPNDPTPWLYSAIQRKQENRYNEAIADLEKSVELNDNRRVYRSQFLLDQDRSIRGTNLAAIYQNNGMVEQSVREAVRAVNNDYGSAPAHLFLANSYNALRDPMGILQRYEAGWSNEMLLSNLLSPVGGGPLSQYVSEQEYSKLFERDGLGFSTLTNYSSQGELREIASQYGTLGNLSYALDVDYHYSNGIRPNNRFSRFDAFATIKLQVTPRDTLLFQTNLGDLETGNVFQQYDPDEVSFLTLNFVRPDGSKKKIKVLNTPAKTYDFDESQDPATMLLGWRHDWNPGQQTVLLVGRLANRQSLAQDERGVANAIRNTDLVFPLTLLPFLGTNAAPSDPALYAQLAALAGKGTIRDFNQYLFDFDYHSTLEAYTAELQHIGRFGPDTLVLGARYQSGQFETRVKFDNFGAGAFPGQELLFGSFPVRQEYDVDFDRISLYAYNTLQLTRWLSLLGGITYDKLNYPENFLVPPINGKDQDLERVSPKAGLILEPWKGAVIRGAYTQLTNGVSFDESIRLEPTQVAGFLQAYRNVAPETFVGSKPGSTFQVLGGSFEQRLASRTYLGVEFTELKQNLDRTIGVFDTIEAFAFTSGVVPSSLRQQGNYREQAFIVTLNQLIGERWSFGVNYRYTRSELEQRFPDLDRQASQALSTPPGTPGAPLVDSFVLENYLRTRTHQESTLHQLNFHALYQHPCGLYARAEANWYSQDNNQFVTGTFPTTDPNADPFLLGEVETRNLGLPPDNFWHFNVMAGYRFYRNQCDISVGVLNLADQDYRLNPLNPYLELPRERSLVVRCKLSF